MEISPIHLAAAALAAIIAPQDSSRTAEWSAAPVPLPEAVTELRQMPDGVYVRAGDWYLLTRCPDGQLCPKPTEEPEPPEAAEDGIPGGMIAVGAGEAEGIQRAWYASPTDRYVHGALGDDIEAAALVAEDVYGDRFVVELDAAEVFEDLTPRVVDIDDDGRNEVITIRTSLRSGSSIAVYGVSGSRLIQRSATPPVGRPHRWVSIAGIADFIGDGRLSIAIVKTPHTGGRLEILAWNRNQLEVVDGVDNFSNHVFGTAEVSLSAIASVNGDRIPDLILPDDDRTSLRMVTAAGGTIRDITSVPLRAEVRTAIGLLSDSGSPEFVVGLADGSLVSVAAR